jgi:hypothetical protein
LQASSSAGLSGHVFGRTGSRVSVAAAGKRVRRGSRCAPQGYDVLLKERNGCYISPDEFARNQRLIADRMGIGAVKGAVRRGELLLAGFLRCGHCGRKLDVFYSGVGRGQTMAGFKRPIVHHLLVAEKIAQLTIQLLLHTLADPKTGGNRCVLFYLPYWWWVSLCPSMRMREADMGIIMLEAETSTNMTNIIHLISTSSES